VALPLVGAVVLVVAEAGGTPGAPGPAGAVAAVVPDVTGARGAVVVLVSSPRRYLPSSVPPQAGAASIAAAIAAARAVAVRSANPSPRNRLGAETVELIGRARPARPLR